MSFYIIAITGDDLNRSRRMATMIQTHLDFTYKELYKTPNYRKYIHISIESFASALDKTVMFIHEQSYNRKININKTKLYDELKALNGYNLWTDIMSAKIEEYKEISKKKPHYDYYLIVPDVSTKEQLNVLIEHNAEIIFNFNTPEPKTKSEIWAYKFKNIRSSFSYGITHLEPFYNKDIGIWYHNNKPEFYMKDFCLEYVKSLNNVRIFGNKVTNQNI